MAPVLGEMTGWNGAYRRLTRRGFGAVSLAAAGMAAFPGAAAARANRTAYFPEPAPDIRYALKLVDEPHVDSIAAHAEPNTSSDVVATIPFETPVVVLQSAIGEKLWYGGRTWYQVAMTYEPGWVYETLLGEAPQGQAAPPLPLPIPTPDVAPSPVGGGRSIVVSLADQFLWAFEGKNVALAIACTTGGVGLETPVGDYVVKRHDPNYMFNSPWPKGSPDYYPSVQASFALLFHGIGYFLHDAAWRRVFGPDSQGASGPLGHDHTGSHGCVNLPYVAAKFLYRWAPNGTPVRVLAQV